MYRRGFLGTLAASTAAGLASLTPLSLEAATRTRRINDNAGDAAATRNIFAKQMPLPLPGTGIEQLLASGAQFGVCNVALTVYSGMVAQKMNMDAATVKADWVAGLMPGVQVVPSGVLAVSRAQEKGCNYCFAG